MAVRATSSATLEDLGRSARRASRVLARTSSATRDEALLRAADLIDQESDRILAANAEDVTALTGSGGEATALDRLRLDASRVAGMAAGLRQVAALADPVGEVVDGWVRPNGLRISRVRVPLGVVGIIYENRPNVTSDAAGLCLKSGYAVLLRGSSTAIRSNTVIASLLRSGLDKAGLPAEAVEIAGPDGAVFAKGLVRHAAPVVAEWAGHRSGELPDDLDPEVVHRDDLVVLG